MENNELSFGSKACGVSFNPGGHALVNEIKLDFANIVDNLHMIRQTTDNAEVKRMLSIAITEAQTAQMWAVKAVTWNF